MVKIEGNPLKIVTGEHTCDPATIDPLMHICLAFASCIAKWLRRYYMSRGITESLYDVDISIEFGSGGTGEACEKIEIVFNTTYENFSNAVKMLESISEECYISRIIKLTKRYTVKCNMCSHSLSV